MSSPGFCKQAAVEREDVQQVEVLALVFVQPLDLHVEERGGIHLDAAVPLDDAREIDLVGVLDAHEFRSGTAGRRRKLSSPRSLSRSRSQPWPILEVISLLSRGLQASSQRRGVMPLVLLLNFPG